MKDLDLEDCTENCAHLYFFDKDGTTIVGVWTIPYGMVILDQMEHFVPYR